MTAAEILKNAQPPADDALIDQAIADLDSKIWEWTDALKSAHGQLRSAFAASPPQRPSAVLQEDSPPRDLQAAAAAAHIPAPPPMPAEWMAPPSVTAPSFAPSYGGHGAANSDSNPSMSVTAQPAANWAQPPASQGSRPSDAGSPPSGAMAWPTAPSPNAWGEPSASPSSPAGPQSWPTWTPSDGSDKSTVPKPSAAPTRASKAPKAARPASDGPTIEDRAQKAAAEESLLAGLDDAIARRVRLLRRLDPDTVIEKLIVKALQGHTEAAAAAAPPKEEKAASSSSSWWRRK